MAEPEIILPDPRPEDLEIMEVGQQKPWLLPRMAEGYSRKYLDGIRPPPYDLLPRKLSHHELIGRWAHQDVNSALRQLARPFFAKPVERQQPRYDSPLAGQIGKLLAPPEDAKRSIIFVHHAYYHFFYLAKALRKRGWRAYSVSTENPKSGNTPYYHGQDLLIWDDDPIVRRELQRELFYAIRDNFKMVHYHGESNLSVFDKNFCSDTMRNGVPWDFLELKAHGVKIGQSISGCLTGQRQSVFNKGSGGVCDKCVWQNNRAVCSDDKNGFVNDKLLRLLDLNALEVDWPLDTSRQTPQSFFDPLTYCFDEDQWHPDLEIPSHIERLERKPGEVLVFHAVGNFNIRDSAANKRNIKGTPAVVEAVERLETEGHPVRLVFKTGVPSKDMRFYQIQADIIVDQIIYGRWGATARETMALGIPTVCHIDSRQPDGVPPSPALAECPLVDATPETIYDVLKDLALNPDKRRKIGEASRAYAVKWHSADACADRFERVYDRIQSGNMPVYRGEDH